MASVSENINFAIGQSVMSMNSTMIMPPEHQMAINAAQGSLPPSIPPIISPEAGGDMGNYVGHHSVGGHSVGSSQVNYQGHQTF